MVTNYNLFTLIKGTYGLKSIQEIKDALEKSGFTFKTLKVRDGIKVRLSHGEFKKPYWRKGATELDAYKNLAKITLLQFNRLQNKISEKVQEEKNRILQPSFA